ncbi:hypothetical protein PoB_006227000 [Plakobranchus ocellatus]|uniref:Uncharacterized protein n=1 Tax=Plakobranchus ocellatus TaxID=259542 RepID=A0AAV4CVD1_9GAST|nr:hypothetical protein PoB_006227000 [Plakobranchus ocellatus]
MAKDTFQKMKPILANRIISMKTKITVNKETEKTRSSGYVVYQKNDEDIMVGKRVNELILKEANLERSLVEIIRNRVTNKSRTRHALGTLREFSHVCEKNAYYGMGQGTHQQDLQGDVGGTVNSVSALRSAATLLSRIRAPLPTPRPTEGLKV